MERRNEKLNKALFHILFVMMLALIFIRYVFQIGFPRELMLIIVAIMAALGSRNEILAICICCIPLYTSFQYLYAVGICLAVFLIKYHKEIRIGVYILPIMLFLAWELLHCADGYSSIKEAVRMWVPFLFCGVVMGSRAEKVDYHYISRSFATCTLFMCFVVIIRLLMKNAFNFTAAFLNMQRLGMVNAEDTVAGGKFNPNTLGFMCLLAAACLLQHVTVKRHIKADVVCIVLLLLFGTLTLSRTFIVCLILTTVLFLFCKKRSAKNIMKYMFSAMLVFAAVIIVLYFMFPSVIEALANRFEVADITSGRGDLIGVYFEFMFSTVKNALFGIGAQNLGAKVQEIFGWSKALVPHNGFQEILVVWGIPGFLCFLAYLYSIIKRAKKYNSTPRLIHYIPFVLIITKVQAGQLVTSGITLLMFAIAYLSLCQDFNERETLTEPEAQSESL